MTQEQFQQLVLDALSVIGKAVAPQQWDSFLVGSGLHPVAPADAAVNPGKYYGTQYDPLRGEITSTQVIEKYTPPVVDAEGNKFHKFIGGTLYQWAKADLGGFMQYYQDTYKTPLVITRLHPGQRALIGL